MIPPQSITFFIDRCLGKKSIPETLQVNSQNQTGFLDRDGKISLWKDSQELLTELKSFDESI
ncbi:hypothetical protein IQ226_19485 [Dolichospermum sp. LEGE 00240]|jgi:hypothetical protein|uniref:hypothetical protein n=1 Tax=Dolichospermum sp. LEGE 00240 TaxID=1828603 RepID=UPI001880BA7F|nr:hypothetical protein [Dolichospermum sp. LEGE 00240]MDM3847092.1 hypothetical protein [Aphanizomenon gracile PMC638.10]MDM3853156.1 hypothetical protein [Aphanizomenon gracile PMC627.10]MDM3856745.1 hypothetical protein [Aphanizomenon gracile PMC649.10]MDM3862077.1 hypothetical protein [Aphanizomenon gracile PMC644.10]MBE9251271.1 hypothetical protein [Dolichospermum sp. LEGE 00240]